MRLPKFEYQEPKDFQEACEILNKEPGARVLAGGTDLLVNMKHRVEQPSVIVNIKKVPGFNAIRITDGLVRIGALTPLKKIFNHPYIAENLPALACAASSVGAFHHQTMGTIGGNLCQQNRCKYYNQSLQWRASRDTCFKAGGSTCYVVGKQNQCWSSYCGDTAPALMVLNARAVLESKGGSREVEVENLFSGEGKNPLHLAPGEILTEILIPQEAAKGSSVYKKMANRESIDFPIVGASLWVSPDKGEFRIAYTAVDRKPLRATRAEQALKEGSLNQQTVEEAQRLAPEEARPVNNSLYPSSYKRRLMGILLGSMVTQCMGRLES